MFFTKTGFPAKINHCTLFSCFFHYDLWHGQNRQVTSHFEYVPHCKWFELKLGMRREEGLLTNFPKFHGDHAISTMFLQHCSETYQTDLVVPTSHWEAPCVIVHTSLILRSSFRHQMFVTLLIRTITFSTPCSSDVWFLPYLIQSGYIWPTVRFLLGVSGLVRFPPSLSSATLCGYWGILLMRAVHHGLTRLWAVSCRQHWCALIACYVYHLKWQSSLECTRCAKFGYHSIYKSSFEEFI